MIFTEDLWPLLNQLVGKTSLFSGNTLSILNALKETVLLPEPSRIDDQLQLRRHRVRPVPRRVSGVGSKVCRHRLHSPRRHGRNRDPLVGKHRRFLRTDGNLFVGAKAFAAGVILATGFVHMLSDATEALRHPCLPAFPWKKFPFTGFFAMMAALFTLLLDFVGTQYYERKQGSTAPLRSSLGSGRPNPGRCSEKKRVGECTSWGCMHMPRIIDTTTPMAMSRVTALATRRNKRRRMRTPMDTVTVTSTATPTWKMEKKPTFDTSWFLR
ncbi:hypothetical protein ACSQ67_018588 [Phaseolus vulgaris]